MKKKAKKKRGVLAPNANAPMQLYPSAGFVDQVNRLKERPALRQYVDTFVAAKNPVELGYLFAQIDFQIVIDTIAVGQDGLEKLSSVWLALNEYGGLVGRIEEPAPPTARTATTLSEEAIANITDIVRDLGEFVQRQTEGVETVLNEAGYRYLPRRLSAPYFAQRFDILTKELGFDLFQDFDRHLADLENALPGKDLAPLAQKVPAPPSEIRKALSSQWVALTDLFESVWTNAAVDIAEVIGAAPDEKGLLTVQALGQQIALWNRYGGALALLGSAVFEKLALDFSASTSGNGSTRHEGHDDITSNWHEAMEESRERILIPGRLVDGASLLALAHTGCYLLGQVTRDANHLLEGALLAGPLLVTSIRERLLLWSPPNNLADENETGIALSTCCYSGGPNEHIEPVVAGARLEFESLYEDLDLEQSPVSDSVFFDFVDKSYLSHDEWAAGPLGDYFFAEGQRRLKNILSRKKWSAGLPAQVTSLKSLSNCLRIALNPPSRDVEASSIWFLAVILSEFSSLDRVEDARRPPYLDCASRLLEDGFIATAGYTFCYFLITEAIESVGIQSFFQNTEPGAGNALEPIGPWRDVCDLAERLSGLGWRERIERTFALATTFIRAGNIESLQFACAQMDALSGGFSLSAPAKEAAAKVVHLVREHPLRERIIEAMGGDGWAGLSSELQDRLVVLERAHDTNLGDEAVYGGRTTGWAIDYAEIVEGIIKEQLSVLWDPVIENKCIEALRNATGGKGRMSSKFSIGSALHICKGAVEKGEAAILERLKAKGVDVHSIGGKFGDAILKGLVTERNKLAHPAVKEEKENAAGLVRLWVLRNLPKVIEVVGLKRKYGQPSH